MKKSHVILVILVLVLLGGLTVYKYSEKITTETVITSLSEEQNAEYNDCIKDWEARLHGDLRPAPYYGTSECMSRLAIKYNDVAMCEIVETDDAYGLAKFFCVSGFASAKDDVNICRTYLSDQQSIASCITNIALKRNDSNLCNDARSYFTDKSAQTYFNDICYDEFAIQQNNSALCEKIVNRSTPKTSALCHLVDEE